MDFPQKVPSSHWDTFSIDCEYCFRKAFSSQLHLKNGHLSSTSHMLSPRSEACTARFRTPIYFTHEPQSGKLVMNVTEYKFL